MKAAEEDRAILVIIATINSRQ